MNTNDKTVEFIQPWVAVGKYAENLTKELQREVTEHHVLWRRRVRPLAQRVDCDDVLFEVDGAVNKYAVVHLTWTGEPENDPQCPDTILFGSIDEWVRDGMMADHREFIGSE
jgi:hypothetical protein